MGTFGLYFPVARVGKFDPFSRREQKAHPPTAEEDAVDETEKARRQGPRGTRDEVKAVRRNAKRAGRELDREQEESVAHLAQALGQISEDEALAHLDARLGFVERQVERLAARREEVDRGIQAELAVTRAGVEEALRAAAESAEEQKEARVSLEKRLLGLVAEGERRAVGMTEALRQELVGRLQEASSRFERVEARLRGEMEASQAALDERAHSITAMAAQAREAVEARVEAAEGRVAEALAGLERQVGDVAVEIAERAGALEARLAEAAAGAEAAAAEAEARAASLEERIEEAVVSGAGILSERIDTLVSDLNARLDREERESEARLSESSAEFRLELGRMREELASRGEEEGRDRESVRRDLIDRIRSSEEKAAGAAIHLESMIREIRRQIIGDEQEWSEAVRGLIEEVSSARVRLQELLGRVGTLESRLATERGASQAVVEGVAGRIEVLEDSLRSAVEEVVTRHGTRLEVLASQVAAFTESELAVEERMGAVDYLKRRTAELADRLEAMARAPAAAGGPAVRPAPDPGPALAALERRLDALASRVEEVAAATPEPPGREIPEHLAARIDELERRLPVSPVILPERKRRRA